MTLAAAEHTLTAGEAWDGPATSAVAHEQRGPLLAHHTGEHTKAQRESPHRQDSNPGRVNNGSSHRATGRKHKVEVSRQILSAGHRFLL